LPLIVRHDDITVQVPTTSPPQAVTFGQDAPACPPLPPVAAVPAAPGVPAAPDDPLGPGAHAPENIPATTANTRTAERAVITDDWRYSI